ncbi:BCNT-domain-containing protein [Microthyrium microscopicum]|uniref:SWR1-complex protein 5 n=1 Tax=Microthyrium microscopicum TaxID=703497 RepID=A0A6A6TXG5_9PEZI|nr:BCNT-domain-containing protein [Microthyrium microscopicum]
MAPPRKPPANDSDDDDRDSDSDFNPTAPVEQEAPSDSSDDDSDAEIPATTNTKPPSGSEKTRFAFIQTNDKSPKGRNRGTANNAETPTKKGAKGRKRTAAQSAVFDSGDEETITEGTGKKKRKVVIEIDENEEGGEGGWVKTRSQRMLEEKEERPLASTVGATINVDDVWQRLASLPIGRVEEEGATEEQADQIMDDDDYITIKRTTRFAGEVETEEKRVHKHSAEAKLYLEEQEEIKKKAKADEESRAEESSSEKPSLRRPLRRPSRFEPNLLGEVRTLPPHLQLRWPRNKVLSSTKSGNARMPPPPKPGTKLNTVDKSRHDWAGYVDKAGIAEELDVYGKSKQSYLGRKDFLNRAEYRLEDERRDARQKTKPQT